MDKEEPNVSGNEESVNKTPVPDEDNGVDQKEKKAPKNVNIIQYPREKLMELSKSPPGQRRPTHLSKEYDTCVYICLYFLMFSKSKLVSFDCHSHPSAHQDKKNNSM